MSAKKFRYRLLAGEHINEDGKHYTQGDIIETDVDLRKKFAAGFWAKFEELKDDLKYEPHASK